MRRSSGRVGIASGVRAAAVAALVSVGLLASAASAFGAIDLGPGDVQPSIAYDATTGYTYVAWSDEASLDTIDLCVVPSGGTSCNGGSGPYKLTDSLASAEGGGPIYFGAKVVTMPGGTVVVVANDDGGSEKIRSPGYEATAGEIAWSSPANGEAFGKTGQGIAEGGKLLAEAGGEMPDSGALALNSTSIFTYGNYYPFGSGATDFTLTAPAPKKTPVPDVKGEFGQSLFTNSGQLAAEEITTEPGHYVVVAGGTDAGTPEGCPDGSDEGTGYGVAKGTPTHLQEQSAWGSSYKVISCVAEAAVLTGGEPDGAPIGVVQSEGGGLNGVGEDGIYFHAFDSSTETFGGAVPISQETPFTLLGATGLSASEDSGGGLYASWVDSRGVELDYSATPTSSWPVPVTALTEGGDPVVAGVGSGNAEVAYNGNFGAGSQEYLQALNYAQLYEAEHKPPPPPPPPPPPTPTATTTSQSGAGISGASLTVPQGTAVTDQAYLSGSAVASAGGTVSYNLYKNNKCTEAATAGSVAGVTDGVAAPSAPVKLGPGTYYWVASYSGDASHDGSASACGTEVLVVAHEDSNIGLPSTKICLSRRKFVVHPRAPKGVKLVSVVIQINGKTVKTGKLSKDKTTVSLIGLPKGTFRVSLITRSSKGKIYEDIRTFHTCVPGKHHKHKK